MIIYISIYLYIMKLSVIFIKKILNNLIEVYLIHVK